MEAGKTLHADFFDCSTGPCDFCSFVAGEGADLCAFQGQAKPSRAHKQGPRTLYQKTLPRQARSDSRRAMPYAAWRRQSPTVSESLRLLLLPRFSPDQSVAKDFTAGGARVILRSDTPTFEMPRLLELRGFRLWRNRAECIHCQGHSHWTVSFTDEVAYCHRCKWRTNTVILARELGLLNGNFELRKKFLREAREHQRQNAEMQKFDAWRHDRIRAVSARYRSLSRNAGVAHEVLKLRARLGKFVTRGRHEDHRTPHGFGISQVRHCRFGAEA